MNLGLPEIIGILVVALLVFGPRKLPELGKSLGQGIREFRKSTQGIREDLEGSLRDEPRPEVKA
jgi:sec-independent protein translocase protein TatA